MKRGFEDKSVIIIGASGGLGSGIAKAFAEKGAKLLLVGRNEQKLNRIAEEIGGKLTIFTLDITDAESIEKLIDFAKSWTQNINIIVNASGCDVRKSLDQHSFDEIQNSLNVNLLGAILITKTFLPYMKNQKGNIIMHIGGFADGRMAFPYYSVDAASRAGLFTFVEAINRELELEKSDARVAFFCPSPSDTEAERPFHPLWRKMGISITPVDKVADVLLNSIRKEKTVTIMGGFVTILFAKINSILPKLADILQMKYYGRLLREFLYGTNQDSNLNKNDKQSSGITKKVAIFLIILSFVLYGLIAIVPFLPLTLGQKAMVIPALIASGEISWWIGVAIVGKQVVMKYRKYLNPCTWFSCCFNNQKVKKTS